MVLFAIIFGVPSVVRFVKEDVTSAVSTEAVEGGLPMPAVTVCAVNNWSLTGWKEPQVFTINSFSNFLEKECNSTEASEIYDCISKRTYTKEESVLETLILDKSVTDRPEKSRNRCNRQSREISLIWDFLFLKFFIFSIGETSKFPHYRFPHFPNILNVVVYVVELSWLQKFSFLIHTIF